MGGVWGFGGSGGGFEGFLGVVADFEVLLRQERGFNRGCHQKVMVFNRFAPSNMFLCCIGCAMKRLIGLINSPIGGSDSGKNAAFHRGCHQKVMVFNRFAPSNTFMFFVSAQ